MKFWDKVKQKIINFLLKRLLGAVVVDDVLQEVSGKLFLGKRLLEGTELRSLIAEAEALENLALWRIINETLKKEALDTGWNKSTSMDQLNAGKTMFYTLDVQASIIKKVKSKSGR